MVRAFEMFASLVLLAFCSLCYSTKIRGNATSQAVEQKLISLEGKINQIVDVHKNDVAKIEAHLESSIHKLKETIEKLEKKLDNISPKKEPFSDSLILNGAYHQYYHWFPGSTWSICWRGSTDGWSSKIFHTQCDNKGPTVTLVRSRDGNIFGAFTNISWRSINDNIAAPGTFLFSFQNKDKVPPFKSVLQNDNYNKAILDHTNYGPTFGQGYDLYLDLDDYMKWDSYTDFGYTFSLPAGYTYGTRRTQSLLAGRPYFRLSDVEVFYLK